MQLTFTITTPPASGTLSQLSQAYSKYGYEPKNGAKILAAPVNVTGSQNRVHYARPQPDYAGVNRWAQFQFVVTRRNGVRSPPGTVTLVPPGGQLVGSSFLLSAEQWTVTGNKAPSAPAVFEPYSRGGQSGQPQLNYYILGKDDLVNVASAGAADTSLWYFDAPSAYFGNWGIAYGGSLSFSIAALAGDFSQLNDMKVGMCVCVSYRVFAPHSVVFCMFAVLIAVFVCAFQTNVVVLECDSCQGPVRKGITLGYSMQTFFASRNGVFDGSAKRVVISLSEAGGWLKDSQNSLQPWTRPSQCDVIQVLSRLSRVRILGDWTRWYETVALDDVQVANTKAQLPVCAMSVPDASICTCGAGNDEL